MSQENAPDQKGKKKKKAQKAEPIRSLKDIKKVLRVLEGQPRNHLLFVFGINTGLPLSTILKLKAGDAKELLKAVKEGRPYKPNSETWKYVQINKMLAKELKAYLAANQSWKDTDFLFKSQKGKGALTSKSVGRLIKKGTKEAGLKGSYGCHSLRKTFAYHQRTRHGVGLDVLSKIFGHNSPADTKDFLGIDKDLPVSILKNEIV